MTKDYTKSYRGNLGGRKEGFVVSDESKAKARNSNPHTRRVVSPHGEYPSIGEAERKLGFGNSLVAYYCRMGELQRKGEFLINGRTGKPNPDYTGWYIIGPKPPNTAIGRPVRTPLGDFNTVKEAAFAHSIGSPAMIRRIKHDPDYQYISL